MTLPLTLWQLHAASLPDSLTDSAAPRGFTLPGLQALQDFSNLLGEQDISQETANSTDDHAPFTLPAMIPPDVCGPVSLRREIDFGALGADRALLLFDHIVGSGRILLDETVLCTFDSARLSADALAAASQMSVQPCMLCVDLTDALQLGRRETLVIEFDAARPAGVPGPVTLHAAQHAHLKKLELAPDVKEGRLHAHVQIASVRTGRYVLLARAFDADGAVCGDYETSAALNAGDEKPLSFALPLSAKAFASGAAYAPGSAYVPAAVKVQLFLRAQAQRSEGLLCDEAVLLCGFGGKAPRFDLPVRASQLIAAPKETVASIASLGVGAISLQLPVPDSAYRLLCRAGIAVRQFMPINHPLRAGLIRFPNLSLRETPEAETILSLEASAWQLCSMISAPRTLDESLSARELLLEASGLPLDPKDSGVLDVLRWLRTVSVRLRAEAARQGRFEGALCGSAEWSDPDIAQALKTAFAPAHLSALPLCGAWWTTSLFSASLQAFIPEEMHAPLTAYAVLEDAEGRVLKSFEAPCPARGGYLGLLEAPLPDAPCVLELTCRLLENGQMIEETTLPVYVGERGPLEAAFSSRI